MKIKMQFWGVLVLLLTAHAGAARAEWSLGDHLDRVVAYTNRTFELFKQKKGRQLGNHSGLLMKTVDRQADGSLRPLPKGMSVGGEVREGQFLLSGARGILGACVEFTISGGSKMVLDYGLCDEAKAKGNLGSLVIVEVSAGDKTARHRFRIDKASWTRKVITLPESEVTRVCILSRRLSNMGTNWTGLVVRGDGRLRSREETLADSPNKERFAEFAAELKPSAHRVTAPEDYDILFYKNAPFLSFAGKGHGTGTHEEQANVAINTFYTEGAQFSAYWPEGTDGIDNRLRRGTFFDLILCQEYDLVYKTAMSMAHCTPFLPPWLVEKENLGFEGHQMRRGGKHHASIFKDKTLHYYKQGLQGWMEPLKDQPAIFVFSQEDRPEDLDDYSDEAKAKWRAWLRRRFDGDFATFAAYVGGTKDVVGFDDAPYPEKQIPHPAVGYPMRLAYLKLLWVQETFGDFLVDVYAFARKRAPGVPLTQRYTNSPFGVYLSRRVGSDYNYTFGHLSTEGWPNNYAVGKKPWGGLYAHAGTLPLPRGGSIGKAPSLKIRRGAITEREFRMNAYTAVANGICGFEYSTVFPSWGPQWTPSSLYTMEGKLTASGHAAKTVMTKLLSLSPYMMHYDHFPDVAVFHDAPFNSRTFGARWSQSKAGLYGLIRETGFHADVLTCWDMTAENLRGKKVLVLGGSLSIAPEIQAAIRDYVQNGGTLVTIFCADGSGIPGCNSYDFAVRPRESAKARCFEDPPAAAHLGDVLGLRTARGLVARKEVRSKAFGRISFDGFNTLLEEKRWVDRFPCCAQLVPAEEARITATFDDGTPAVVENTFGKGRAVTFAFDLGLIANNLTVDPMYQAWSDLLTSLGCRKAVDTGNWRVEGGSWHDDNGHRVMFLVNHDTENPQNTRLPNGRTLTLPPGESRAVVMEIP